jgi:hypothetical protein
MASKVDVVEEAREYKDEGGKEDVVEEAREYKGEGGKEDVENDLSEGEGGKEESGGSSGAKGGGAKSAHMGTFFSGRGRGRGRGGIMKSDIGKDRLQRWKSHLGRFKK